MDHNQFYSSIYSYNQKLQFSIAWNILIRRLTYVSSSISDFYGMFLAVVIFIIFQNCSTEFIWSRYLMEEFFFTIISLSFLWLTNYRSVGINWILVLPVIVVIFILCKKLFSSLLAIVKDINMSCLLSCLLITICACYRFMMLLALYKRVSLLQWGSSNATAVTL